MGEEFLVQEESKKLNELTGKIISIALSLEDQLEFFISNYFIFPQNQKTFFFDNLIIKNMNFEKKVDIFKKICEREKFDKEKLKKSIKHIKIVQKIRNDFAHQHVIFNPTKKEISIGNRKKYEFQILNSKETLEILKENKGKATLIILEFYQKYYKDGTIDDHPERLNSCQEEYLEDD